MYSPIQEETLMFCLRLTDIVYNRYNSSFALLKFKIEVNLPVVKVKRTYIRHCAMCLSVELF